jgi:hypothetical protein
MPSKPIELQSEIAKALEPVWDGRIYIEAVNGPMLFKVQGKGDAAEYKAGLDRVIAKGWLLTVTFVYESKGSA